MNDFKKLSNFVNFSNKFREIVRVVDIKGSNNRENDAEHSFQLALTALYLIDKDNLKLDKTLVLEYALTHDLVEIYAGDSYFLDKNSRTDKAKREQHAYEKIVNDFPEFNSYKNRFKEYENKENKEALFVYVLDKILPALNIYLNNGKTLKIENANYDELMKNKSEKVQYSDELKPYFEELLRLFKKDRKKLFNN